MSDNLKIEISGQEEKILAIIHDNSERITSLDKISNVDRIRFTGRGIIVENTQSTKQTDDIHYAITLDKTSLDNLSYDNILHVLDHEIKVPLLVSIHVVTNITPKEISALNNISKQFGNDVEILSHIISSSNNLTILVLLVPISGYILIRSENEQLRIKNSRQFLSSFFIVILLSSTVITPFSISGNYWWMAFADNSTDNNSNSSLPVTVNASNINTINASNINTINASNINVITNSTTVPSNSNMSKLVSTPDNLSIDTNQTASQSHNGTSLVILSDNLSIDTNQTASQSHNGTSLVILSDNLSIDTNQTASQSHNGTSLVILSDDLPMADTNQTMSNQEQSGFPLPNATKSFNFTSLDGSIGKTRIANQTLQLQGQGYLSQEVNETNSLKQLTLSTWVLPDYSQGSPVFTVVSKENQFTLAINNLLAPKQIAQFSVFDGIKWNTINSTTPIVNWTHLAVYVQRNRHCHLRQRYYAVKPTPTRYTNTYR